MKRPYIICHMLTSLDGKTTGNFLTTEEIIPATSAYERINHHFNATAWLSGRISIEENFTFFNRPIFESNAQRYPREDYVAQSHAQAYMVVIDTSGKIAWKTNTLHYQDRPAAHIIEILTDKVSDEYVSYLRQRQISFIFAGEDELNLSLALEKLYLLFAIKTLVVSGGGRTNAYFLKENLIDELSLIISPMISAEDNAITLFNGANDLQQFISTAYQLKSVEKLDANTVWLLYHNLNQHSD